MDNNSLKKWISNNGKMIAVLYIILVIIILLSLVDVNTLAKLSEPFTGSNSNTDVGSSYNQSTDNQSSESNTSTNSTVSATEVSTNVTSNASNLKKLSPKNVNMKKPIHNILISLNDPNLYYGSYISLSGSGNHKDNFIYTNSLASNKWLKPKENLSLTKSHVIIDLTYDPSKRLTAVGLKMNKKGEPEYDIFKKKTSDFKSDWVKMDSNKKIRSLCNEIKDGTLLGISSYDGQIYESRNRLLSYGDWIGPINYDTPMRKVMFDREGYMIGIGLVDNYIYKKKTKFWKESKWDRKNVNKTKVYDLIYDLDGCFIACTEEGIKKQVHPDFGSEFVLYTKFNQDHEKILDQSEIILYKTGNEFLDNQFDLSTELGRDLKRIYEFKKISKDLCKNRHRFNSGTLNPKKELVDSDALSKQNDEIKDLYKKIDILTNKLAL